LTPTLIHFGGVLFESLFVLAPWSSAWPIGIILGVCGLSGLIYQIYVILMQRKIDFASPDWLDWALFSAAPALCAGRPLPVELSRFVQAKPGVRGGL